VWGCAGGHWSDQLNNRPPLVGPVVANDSHLHLHTYALFLDANDSHLHLHIYALFLDENDSHLHLHTYALFIHWSEQ
jgi:hypothetical protein